MPNSAFSRTTALKEAPVAKLNTLIAQQDFKQALPICRNLVKKNPRNPQLFELLSDCLWALGKHHDGLDTLEETCRSWPRDSQLWGKLGSRLMRCGEFDRAYAAFAKMRELAPRSGFALTAMNLIHTFQIEAPETETLNQLASDTTIPSPERVSVLNALGRIHAKAKDPETAMAYFLRSKQETPGEYHPAVVDHSIRQQKANFFVEDMPQVPQDTANLPRFAFITGLPRSGTTLMETLLVNHQDVATTGESPALLQTRKAIQQMIAPETLETGQWDWCRKLSPPLLAAARNAFAKQSLSETEKPVPVVLDKMPHNCLEMGFARMILPNARFIFMQRHPLDVGISLLSNDFATGHAYTKRIEKIAHYIRATYDSLYDFKPKLGVALRIQSYRALVEDPEPQMRAVLSHLNLSWNDACLAPSSNEGVIRTASIVQVRKGLNQNGLGKWKLFEKQLAPMIEGLGGWEWIEAWEDRDRAS